MNTSNVFLYVFAILSFSFSGQITAENKSGLLTSRMNNTSALHPNYEDIEIISENDQKTEDWMRIPFNTNIAEDELLTESWMEELFLKCLK